MTLYIAFIRGINVGGKNKLKMADLQLMCENLGLTNVKTFIQSGNVFFESNEEEPLIDKLENAIKGEFSVSTKVILRDIDELEAAISDCPFTEEEIQIAETENSESESLYLHLMNKSADSELTKNLNKYISESDRYKILGKTVYILLTHSIRHSKLAAQLDKAAEGTTRSLKSIRKLMDKIKHDLRQE